MMVSTVLFALKFRAYLTPRPAIAT